MNKALFGILGFALGALVFTSVNQSKLFTDASQSGDALIEQLDGILAHPRFDNRDYTLWIIEKTQTLSEIFAEDSTPYLAMRYLNASLKAKVKKMPAPVIKEEEKEEVHNAAEQGTTTTTTNNEYKGTAAFPVAPKLKEQAAPAAKAAPVKELNGFNMGRQAAPEKSLKSTRKWVSNVPSYKYEIDGKTYDTNCRQLECMMACVNLKKAPSEATCAKQCVADVCLDVKKHGKLSMHTIKYAAPAQ